MECKRCANFGGFGEKLGVKKSQLSAQARPLGPLPAEIQEVIMNTFLKYKFEILASASLAALSVWLLGDDSKTFLAWWLAVLVLGCTFMPFTGLLFSGFQDKGWLFSKAIAIAIAGYLTWLPTALGILKFTSASCIAITLLCIGANALLAFIQHRQKPCPLTEPSCRLMMQEELIFVALFLFWAYVAGFRPQAYGEEKFMDFGFMAAMMRGTELPFPDIWYSQSPVNYYYGGQYYAVFLTKLTLAQVSSTYNLMRSLVAGMAFALPFSLVWQAAKDYYGKGKRRAVWSGLLAGIAVSLCGNMHYVIYGIILPLVTGSDFWFPESTRYIGHNPETYDQTIHEFPAYSFIQGDLHAHMVNIYFVLSVLGLLYAWMKREGCSRRKALFQMPLLMCGIFLGIFQWSNAWDFAIYYVIICGICFFNNLKWSQNWKDGIFTSVVQWVEVLALSILAALPFTLQFDSGMAQGIRLVKNHSAFYQLCVLWALPVAIVIVFLVKLFLEHKPSNPIEWLKGMKTPDLFILTLALCALGLILLPEVIYLRDIYEEVAARSNTMFKLTYQAFILFGICMGFLLIRFLTDKPCKWVRVTGILGTACLLLTSGYTATAIKQWNGEIWNREGYLGLDATAFLENQFPQDEPAIRWLQTQITGTPVVLEAPGTSYSNYCRVSAMTGLPTVLGWYTHEHLWRGDTEDLNFKTTQIETIYTSTNEAEVRSLLEEFQVSYIFIGQMEREKYLNLNESLLRSMGEVVYDNGATIIQVGAAKE